LKGCQENDMKAQKLFMGFMMILFWNKDHQLGIASDPLKGSFMSILLFSSLSLIFSFFLLVMTFFVQIHIILW